MELTCSVLVDLKAEISSFCFYYNNNHGGSSINVHQCPELVQQLIGDTAGEGKVRFGAASAVSDRRTAASCVGHVPAASSECRITIDAII